MELATANAVFQSAMKIPAFVAKPIISCFLFLFACFLFLLIAPNITKPAFAASCRVNTTTQVTPGYTINVGTDGVDTSLSTALALNPAGGGSTINLGPIKVSSVSGATAADYQLPPPPRPGIPLGTYSTVVVVGGFFIPCDGGMNGSGSVQVIAPLCSFSFSPTNVAPGGQFNIQSIGGLTGDTFNAGLKNGPSGSTLPPNQTGTIPSSSLTFTAPNTVGPYTVFVTDTTYGNDCVIPGLASNILTVGVGATPTPQPTPGTGCNIVPTNNSWGSDLQPPAVSGNTVTFSPGTHSFINYGIIVEDSTTGTVPSGGSSGTLTQNTWQLTLPNGTYCAAVFYGTAAVSNVVTFTVPSGTAGDTCTSPGTPWNTMYCDAITKGYFGSSVFTVGQSADVIDALNVMIWGHSQNTPQINQIAANNGALALTSNAVASLYSAPPASGVQYFAQKIHDLNPVTPAYAAAGGIGYQTLGPVQKIWIAFRNMAYVGFILVFVIIGFMIMFRAHISPQAVATVQDSIPRLVIALILVTFSYAIAGFMIDIMFLLLNIAIQALVSAKLITGADYIFNQNVFQVIWGSWTGIFAAVAGAVRDLLKSALSLPGFLNDIAAWFGGGLAGLVIGIALLFIMFRIFLMLLMAYVMIIILTMFAPFFFLIQALPGNNGAKEWFRQMASNIAVFPTVALMFILAGILGGIGALAPGASAAIQPGQIGQFPLIVGNLNAQAIGQLIGIGFLLVTPSAADIVKNAMGGKGGGGGGMGNIGAAALAGAGAGMAVVGAAGRGAWEQGYKRSPFGQWAREGEQMRQERASVQAREKIFQKIKGTPEAEKYEKRGLGYHK